MSFNFVALCFSVVLNVIGTLFLKQSAENQKQIAPILFLCGGFSFFCALIFYSYALKKINLSFAQPFSAGLGLINIALLSWLFFGEKLSPYGVLGIGFVLLGIVFLKM